MSNELARMRFRSKQNPNRQGAVVLTDDGYIRVEPDDSYIVDLARSEFHAVEKSRIVGMFGFVVFCSIGVAIAIAAWVAGRTGGEARTRLTRPYFATDVELTPASDGGVTLSTPGKDHRPVTLGWAADEIDAAELANLSALYLRFRELPPPPAG